MCQTTVTSAFAHRTFAVLTKAPRWFHCPYSTMIKSRTRKWNLREVKLCLGLPSRAGTWGSHTSEPAPEATLRTTERPGNPGGAQRSRGAAGWKVPGPSWREGAQRNSTSQGRGRGSGRHGGESGQPRAGATVPSAGRERGRDDRARGLPHPAFATLLPSPPPAPRGGAGAPPRARLPRPRCLGPRAGCGRKGGRETFPPRFPGALRGSPFWGWLRRSGPRGRTRRRGLGTRSPRA